MTKASNKVDWCLQKTKKELEEGKKHRGLVKSEPNNEETLLHVAKAEHNLRAISYFNKGGYSD